MAFTGITFYENVGVNPVYTHKIGLNFYENVLAWTAPNLKPKVGGVVKSYSNGWVKVAGVNRQIDSIWIKVNGTIKKI